MYEQKRSKNSFKNTSTDEKNPDRYFSQVQTGRGRVGWAQVQAWPVDIRHSEFQAESPAQRRAVCAAGNLQVPVTLQGNTGNRL